MIYDGQKLPVDLRLDLLVEDSVIVELKAVASLNELHAKQLMTYLRLMEKKVGLLINFNTVFLDGESIVRIVNDYKE